MAEAVGDACVGRKRSHSQASSKCGQTDLEDNMNSVAETPITVAARGGKRSRAEQLENPDFFNSFVDSMITVPNAYATSMNTNGKDDRSASGMSSTHRIINESFIKRVMGEFLQNATMTEFLKETRAMDDECCHESGSTDRSNSSPTHNSSSRTSTSIANSCSTSDVDLQTLLTSATNSRGGSAIR